MKEYWRGAICMQQQANSAPSVFLQSILVKVTIEFETGNVLISLEFYIQSFSIELILELPNNFIFQEKKIIINAFNHGESMLFSSFLFGPNYFHCKNLDFYTILNSIILQELKRDYQAIIFISKIKIIKRKSTQ